MSQQTFNVHFILKVEKTNKKGLAPIFARVRLNGIKTELTTNRGAGKENWDAMNEVIFPVTKQNKEINQYLESFKAKIYNGYTLLLSTGQEMSVELLKEAIFGKPIKKKYSLIEVAKEHNEKFEQQIGHKYSYGSFKNYKSTLKYLIEFIPLVYKKPDIPLEIVDYGFCEKYFTFLTMQKKCNNNGANKQLQRIKKIINYSIRLGYTDRNLMNSYQLEFNPVNKIPLTMDEINKLAMLLLHRKTLIEVRDVFVFQCYTGLPYGDLKALKPINIHKVNGEFWIKMEREKTEISFSVPLLKPAVDILLKYYQPANPNSIFPVLSNQKMNENLKVIQEIAGISKNLTTHLGRHSFATSVTLNNDVPLETVSKMLGHTNIRTTQLYAKVLDNKIDRDMKQLKDKIG